MTAPGTTVATAPPTSRLRRLWEGWKRVAHRIGNVQARIILTVFYIVVVTPFAIAVRALSDPMRFAAPPAWLPRETPVTDVSTTARRQY
jgi:hypothetical protein